MAKGKRDTDAPTKGNDMNNLEKHKADLEALINLGQDVWEDLSALSNRSEATELTAEALTSYQRWYTEAYVLLEQLLPGRLIEFEQLYKGDGRRRIINLHTYTIQDLLTGIEVDPSTLAVATLRFINQLAILESVEARFESSLFEIRQLVQADLFDSELDAARELTRGGFLRAAGAVAGVVLERHLGQVAANHAITTRKKNPTIGDFNDLLKDGGVLDIPSWRQVQRFGDIRNLCDHNKERGPKKDEVEELIDGVEKYTKTLF